MVKKNLLKDSSSEKNLNIFKIYLFFIKNLIYFKEKNNLANMLKKIKLVEIASARSGDKNDICNVGLMAKDPKFYPILKEQVSAELVKAHFGPLIKGAVIRYEWDAIESLNFVCHQALDGGGSRSMRMDTLGKNFSSHLLRLEIEIEEAILKA